MELYEQPQKVKTRWVSFENSTGGRANAGLANRGAKGHASDMVRAGETVVLLDVKGSGAVRRMWCTIPERTPEMLRSLRLEMFWDGSATPAVACPLGDFFGIGLGRRCAFENALFSDPEGRSFNCFIPMPFKTAAKITLTNESPRLVHALFYDIELLLDVKHGEEMRYFHAHWRRESPNTLGKEYDILPRVTGRGRFLGCNLGIMTNPAYEGAWFGEGEVKVWFGDDAQPTLCGTGTEDYIGSAWGQGKYAHRTQGCPIADEEKRQWAFYRYHIDDPVFFNDACRVAIQTIGGWQKERVIQLQAKGAALLPITIHPAENTLPAVRLLELAQPLDARDPGLPDGWCNFWRQDDWSSTAYFYLDAPTSALAQLAPVADRIKGLLKAEEGAAARADG